jgi:hypothetical protein
MWRVLAAGLVVVLAVTLSGCPSNGNGAANGNTNDNTSAAQLAPATWQRTSGAIFGGGPHELTHMVLNNDATAEFYYRHAEIGFVTCAGGLFEQTATMLTVAISGPEVHPELVLYEMLDADTLQLTDVNGEQGVFVRATLPAEVECRELTVLNTYSGVARPDSWTGLAYDTTQLWYTNGDRDAQGVQLTGVLGSTLDLTGIAHGYQENALWLTAGGGPDADRVQRRDRFNALLDEVDTTALGAPTDITALAYDDINGILWLHGQASDGTGYRFVRVNVQVDPAVLLGTNDFNTNVQSIAFDGSSLWLLVAAIPHIVQVDPDTLTPLHTYAAPTDATWQGLAWAEGSLYLIGADASGGVLIQTQP